MAIHGHGVVADFGWDTRVLITTPIWSALPSRDHVTTDCLCSSWIRPGFGKYRLTLPYNILTACSSKDAVSVSRQASVYQHRQCNNRVQSEYFSPWDRTQSLCSEPEILPHPARFLRRAAERWARAALPLEAWSPVGCG